VQERPESWVNSSGCVVQAATGNENPWFEHDGQGSVWIAQRLLMNFGGGRDS
jgi:hypothetical protein